MRRPGDQERTLERIAAWRRDCPDLTLRSTFITGFPGETAEDFSMLLDWLSEAKLDRVGAFPYEPVTGAAANALPFEPVPTEVRKTRYDRLMAHQQTISARRLARRVGRHLKVLIDEGGPRGGIGRSMGDAPEIDGKVHVTSRRPLRPGELATVNIRRSDAYDLFGIVG